MITLLLLLLQPKALFSSYGGQETPCKCLPKSYHKPKDKDHVSLIVDLGVYCAPLRYPKLDMRYVFKDKDLKVRRHTEYCASLN